MTQDIKQMTDATDWHKRAFDEDSGFLTVSRVRDIQNDVLETVATSLRKIGASLDADKQKLLLDIEENIRHTINRNQW